MLPRNTTLPQDLVKQVIGQGPSSESDVFDKSIDDLSLGQKGSGMPIALTGAQIFDGWTLRSGVLVLDGDRVKEIADTVPANATEVRLAGGFLVPGLIDLQVNGGAGVMVSGQTTQSDLAAICDAHARSGTTAMLPTLITDSPEATDRLISTAIASKDVPGFLGLHLEGPHLDPRRKGAHDASLIRAMTAKDLQQICGAASMLPCLMVTLAPEATTAEQIRTLSAAGVIVSLGHSDCTHEQARCAIEAGARCATHLFNAMSQIAGREPGLAGTVLTTDIACGVIADGIHVHPSVIALALRAKTERVFLVSDAMAPAGTDQTSFDLGGRRILRAGGRLTLEDGTLAGADLTLPRAIQILVDQVGVPLERALAMATRIPADVIGRADIGRFSAGARADCVHLSSDLDVKEVWRSGARFA